MMQCKDIPEAPVLRFIAAQDRPCGWHDLQPRSDFCPTVLDAMPPGTPEKLALAKMRRLIQRGMVSGCACGCRGDFEITTKGDMEKSGLADDQSRPPSAA